MEYDKEFISEPVENFDDWTDLENKIKPMQQVELASPDQENEIGSRRNSPEFDAEVLKAVKEDDCIKAVLKDLKARLLSFIKRHAPPAVNKYLEKEENNEENKEEKGFWGRLWDSVKNILYNLKEAVASFWNKIMDILKKVFQILEGTIKKTIERVEEILLFKFRILADEVSEEAVKIVTKLLGHQIEVTLGVSAAAYAHAHQM